MRVLFLDFDGVLNYSTFLRKNPEGHFVPYKHLDPEAIERVNTICQRTKAVVVISSTWRLLYEFEELRGFLTLQGGRFLVIDKTPNLNQPRGEEIQAWLDKHPGVESFAILDDDEDMEPVLSHLVRTSFQTGLLDKHVEKAVALLR